MGLGCSGNADRKGCESRTCEHDETKAAGES
jgi:hypothetical protein